MAAPDDHARRRRVATLRFYEELNDFLPAERRRRDFEVEFTGERSVKDLVQAVGVPHTEIDLLLVDGTSVDFDHRLRGGERVSVYPTFERLDVTPVTRLRPRPLREPRFVCDVHLGKLARDLRTLGFDTAYGNDLEDEEIVRLALAEHRTILTRDLGILQREAVTHGYWLRSTDPDEQVREVVDALELGRGVAPFTRCRECNGPLLEVAKDEVAARLPPRIRAEYEDFARCPGCGRVYWKGSHYDRMRERLGDLLDAGSRRERDVPPPKD